MLRVKGWSEHYESNETRKRHRIARVMIPNKLDGDGYIALVSHERGPAHFGVWVAIVEIASRCHPRGDLVRDTGQPHDATSIASKTRMPEALVAEAVERLLSIGWLESAADRQPSAQSPAAWPPHSAVQRESESENENETESEKRGVPVNGTPARGKERAAARHAPKPRFTGSSFEWDGCIRIMGDIGLDFTAKARLESSPLDDADLYRLLSDVVEGRGRIKEPSRWVVSALSKREGGA